MQITVIEAHAAIFLGVVANLATVAGVWLQLRSMRARLNGHLRDHMITASAKEEN